MKVVIYSTPSCSYCKMAKSFLSENNIDFQEIDVSVDQQAAESMVEKTGQLGVPVIIVVAEDGNETTLIGFERDALSQALGL